MERRLSREEIRELVAKYPRVLDTMEEPYKTMVLTLVKSEKLDKARGRKPAPSKN